MVLLEFSMAPLGKGESVSEYVTESLRIIRESGLDYRLHAMGTVIEGEWDEVFAVVTRCFESMKEHCPRITCSIKVDHMKTLLTIHVVSLTKYSFPLCFYKKKMHKIS